MTDLRPEQRLEMGRVVSRAFSVIGSNFGMFFGLSLLFSSIPGFAITYAYDYFGLSMIDRYGALTLTSFSGIIANLLASIPAYIAIGAVTHGAIVSFNSGKASFGDCAATGFRKFLPLFLLGIVTNIGILIGVIFLIIPGVIVALVLCVSAPAMVVENTGVFGSMSRSSTLTENNRWAILGLVVIFGIVTALITMVVTFVLGGVLAVLGSGSFSGDVGMLGIETASPLVWISTVISIVADALGAMIGAAGVASLYYELRTNKEGASSDELAKVFD
jgi:hypothetical protein